MRNNLNTARFFASLSVAWERFWTLILPLLAVICVFACISWFGIWLFLPETGRIILLCFFLLAVIVSLWRLRNFQLPKAEYIDKRLEIKSALQHNPIATQKDQLVIGVDNPSTHALWLEHKRRISKELIFLRAGLPEPKSNDLDPWGLRVVIPLLLAVSFAYSLGNSGGKILDAFKNHSSEYLKKELRVDAWITPPAYTNKPSILLSNFSDKRTNYKTPIIVPKASSFYFRLVDKNVPVITYTSVEKVVKLPVTTSSDLDNHTFQQQQAPIHEVSFLLKHAGTITLTVEDKVVQKWKIDIVSDDPPKIEFVQPPNISVSGTLDIAYKMKDDYGVISAMADITPINPVTMNARPLLQIPQLQLSLPQHRTRSGSGKISSQTLFEHPLAGLEVAIQLIAVDDSGQKGYSQIINMVLPRKKFLDPLALAILEQRHKLAIDANKSKETANMIDAITFAGEEFFSNLNAYLGLRVAYRRIIEAKSDSTLRDALDLMWEIALDVEYGDISDIERRLRDAQEALSEALANDAGEKQITSLVNELRDAMNTLIQSIAGLKKFDMGIQNPFLSSNQSYRILHQKDFQRMLDQIDNLAKLGSRDAARQLLAQMQGILSNLANFNQTQNQGQKKNNPMHQVLDMLYDLIQRQQNLIDETFRTGKQKPSHDQLQNEVNFAEFSDAMQQLQAQQKKIQDQLGELSKKLENLDVKTPEQFSKAEEYMVKAQDNLGKKMPGSAIGDQSKALELLQEGGRSLLQNMANNQGSDGQQYGGFGSGYGGNQGGSDPLGRSLSETQDNNGISKHGIEVPNEINSQRAREIMKAIRDRLSQPTTPIIEKKYLERLLQEH